MRTDVLIINPGGGGKGWSDIIPGMGVVIILGVGWSLFPEWWSLFTGGEGGVKFLYVYLGVGWWSLLRGGG